MNRKRLALIAIASVAIAWIGWAVGNDSSEPVVGVWIEAPMDYDYDPPEIPGIFDAHPKLGMVLYPTRMEFRKDGTWTWRRGQAAEVSGVWKRRGDTGSKAVYECRIDGEVVGRIECSRTQAWFYYGLESTLADGSTVSNFPIEYVRPGNWLSELISRLRNWRSPRDFSP